MSPSKNTIDELFKKAQEAHTFSYSPYSHYQVASAVLMDNNKIYSGVNIENASYGATMCAERVAIFKALSEGAKKIKAILVLIKGEKPWPPCGQCLQVISEFANSKTLVILMNHDKEKKEFLFNELLPQSFKLKQN